MDNFAEYMVKKQPDSSDRMTTVLIILAAVLLSAATVFLVLITKIPFILIVTCAVLYGAYFLITNQDGVVDQADADQIHASEVYQLGDIKHVNREDYFCGALYGAELALLCYSVDMAGQPAEIVQKDIDNLNPWGHPTVDSVFDGLLDNITDDMRQQCQIDQVTFNLLDANADGVVDINDSFALLCAYSYAFADQGFFPTEGRYD